MLEMNSRRDKHIYLNRHLRHQSSKTIQNEWHTMHSKISFLQYSWAHEQWDEGFRIPRLDGFVCSVNPIHERFNFLRQSFHVKKMSSIPDFSVSVGVVLSRFVVNMFSALKKTEFIRKAVIFFAVSVE